MQLFGDCLTCSRLGSCTETSEAKVRSGYTCPLFMAVPEPVYLARWEMMKMYGEKVAVDAMLNRPPPDPELEGEEDGSADP